MPRPYRDGCSFPWVWVHPRYARLLNARRYICRYAEYSAISLRGRRRGEIYALFTVLSRFLNSLHSTPSYLCRLAIIYVPFVYAGDTTLIGSAPGHTGPRRGEKCRPFLRPLVAEMWIDPVWGRICVF